MQAIAPCAGRLSPVTECVDEVFSTQMVGPGVVIDPPDGEATVVSPIAGKLVKVHPHAFIVVGEAGIGVLVHLGINTVHLEGAGFEVLTSEGTTVSAGDPMVVWDPATLPTEAGGMPISRQVPVIVLDRPADSLDLTGVGDEVATGDVLFALT